ncbi:putative chitinase [Chitinophaga dinghuensis]|uniref:Putative chitinase n=1 Tax=Chitinophaga dinghuensis TaxID=1539050 RepID=A0A327VQ48_9BACT|nr:PAAR-like protein [Chitinophaga dinghuensis]RAJ75688.1 putative chitinase [Chitinophaga dinghuensis]
MTIVNQPLHLVCEGALCTCDKAVNPVPVKMKVVSQRKFHVKDHTGEPTATTGDQYASSLNFKLCKIPDPQKPTPCVPVLQWSNYYEDIMLPGGLHPLSEKSEATCSRGGKVKILQHGQTMPPGNARKPNNAAPAQSIESGTASAVTATGEVEDAAPALCVASWQDDRGQPKIVTGWHEKSRLYLSFNNAEGMEVAIEIVVTDSTRRQLTVLKQAMYYTVKDGVIAVDFFPGKQEYRHLLQDGDFLYARIKSTGMPISKLGNLRPRRPLLFREHPKIREVKFYNNGSPVITAHYGDTITCKIVASNMCREKLDVKVKRLEKRNGRDWERLDKTVFNSTLEVNEYGYLIFDFELKKEWESEYEERVQRFYLSLKTSQWDSWWHTISAFPVVTTVAKQQHSPVVIQTIKPNSKEPPCPRCTAPVTMEQIKQIAVDSNGNMFLQQDQVIREALGFFNQHCQTFELDTCCRKAHFFAQIATETRFQCLEENFNYASTVLQEKFKHFRNGEGPAHAADWGRRDNDSTPVSAQDQEHIANWAYADINGNGGYSSGDGYRFKGRGFIQLTGRGNYKEASRLYNKWIPGNNVDWENQPERLSEVSSDAMAAAMIFWRSHLLAARANYADAYSVESVSRPINAALDNIHERKRFFKEAVKAFQVMHCSKYLSRAWQEPNHDTIVVVGAAASDTGNEHYLRDNNDVAWPVYPLVVYRRLSLELYKQLLAKDALPAPDYTTWVTRDAHGEKYGKHDAARYGHLNECPPGEYYLNRGNGGQRYSMYISDTPGLGSAEINGPNGYRSGIAIHGGWPVGSVGCLTTHSTGYLPAKNMLVRQLLGNLPELDKAVQQAGDRHVRIIIQPREVATVLWDKTMLGTSKWSGIITAPPH